MFAMQLTPVLRSTAEVRDWARSIQESYAADELDALARLDPDQATREKAELATSAAKLLWALEDAATHVN
jgi:uncharacterized protein YcbK (DUF882 family)